MQRSIFAGSEFYDDLTDALLDRVDQRLLCREAEGINPVTGVSTRESLECG